MALIDREWNLNDWLKEHQQNLDIKTQTWLGVCTSFIMLVYAQNFYSMIWTKLEMKTKLLFFESNLYPSDHLATKLTTFYLSCHPSYGCYQSELESHPLADRKTKHIRNDNHILTQHREIKVLREIKVNWTKRKGNKATGAKSHVPLECA